MKWHTIVMVNYTSVHHCAAWKPARAQGCAGAHSGIVRLPGGGHWRPAVRRPLALQTRSGWGLGMGIGIRDNP